jgi:undecaprenyl-diphosphatase
VNYQLFQAINGLAGRADGLDDAMEFAANWLIYGVFAVAAALVGAALYERRRRPVGQVAVALALAFVAATAISHLSGEVRPFQTHHVHQLIAHENGTSLPSDHATAAFTIAVAIGVFLHRRWGAVLLVAAAVIGLARIWVGVHYPGDIATALVIAVLAVGAVALAGRARPAHRRVTA